MAKKLNKMKKEELELLSYNDIANMILIEEPKQTTLDIFKKIVEMLELSSSTLENKIGDFYTALTKDHRFKMLDDGTWDLTSKYKSNIISLDEDMDDYDELEEYDDIVDDIEEDDLEDDYSDNDETNDTSDVTEEYKNLVIVDEDELDQD